MKVIEGPNLLVLPGGGLREVNVYTVETLFHDYNKKNQLNPSMNLSDNNMISMYMIFHISIPNISLLYHFPSTKYTSFFTLMVFTAIHPFFFKVSIEGIGLVNLNGSQWIEVMEL